MGKAVTAFKDIGKACSDLLTKDYKVGKSTVELKTKTPNGITFTPTGTKSGDKFDGSCSAKGSIFGIETEAKLDTKGLLSGTFEAVDSIYKGLTLKAECESGKSATLGKLDCTAEYKQDMLFAKLAYDYFGSVAGVQLSTAYNALTMGCSADYSLKKSALTKYGLACQYVAPDFVVAAKIDEAIGKSDGQVYTCSYYHKVSGDMQVGGEVKKPMKKNDLSLAFGCQYKLDKDTTVKSKVDSEGMLYASYKQKISKLTTMTLAAQIDTVNLSESKHKFGMVLNLTP